MSAMAMQVTAFRVTKVEVRSYGSTVHVISMRGDDGLSEVQVSCLGHDEFERVAKLMIDALRDGLAALDTDEKEDGR